MKIHLCVSSLWLCLLFTSCLKDSEDDASGDELKLPSMSKTPKPFEPVEDSSVEADETEEDRIDLRYFLRSEYEPLEVWMDERFEVKMREMTPEIIVNTFPLSDIHFDTDDLKGRPYREKFEIENENISRRELLKEIADFWDLDMKLRYEADGIPSELVVFPRP